ncbi:MAG: hypothetical protein SVX28_08310 [Pseudomonadota bacterium]|nr:hypothetical protein [Pseudomonadota bacterium]
MSLTRHRLPEAEAVMDELLLRRKNAASRSYWLPSAVIIIMGQDGAGAHLAGIQCLARLLLHPAEVAGSILG